MAIWNKYFWKQPARVSCRSVIASSIRNIFAMCCEQVAPPRYSSAGSSSELTEDYCEQYSDLFRPGEYGVSQQPGTSSCTSLTSCLVLCMSSSRLYPVLSDYFQLYWCLASINIKLTILSSVLNMTPWTDHMLCFQRSQRRGEPVREVQWSQLGIPCKDEPWGSHRDTERCSSS